MNEDYKLDSTTFFRLLGFKDIHIMDVSDYEGADIIFDLNNRELPDELKGQFEFIFNIGTLEHVFDLKAAMDNLSLMCSKTGHIFHNVPFRIEHGYHSISPAFFVDYYRKNKWDIDFVKLSFSKNGNHYYYSQDIRYYNSRYDVLNYVQEMMESGYIPNLFCGATKSDVSTCNLVPQQSFYEQVYQEQNDMSKYQPVPKEELIAGTVKFLEGLENGSAVIYGTGAAFNQIVNECIKAGLDGRIKAVADRDDNLLGQYIRGYEVMSIEQINRDKDIRYIIIASFIKSADIVYNRISGKLRKDIKIIRLYELF